MNLLQEVAVAGGGHQDGDRWLPGAMAHVHSAAGSGVSLVNQLISLLRRRKWVVGGFILFSLLIGLLATILATPQYTASSTIDIQREVRNFASVDDKQSDSGQWMDNEFYQTQYGLLKSQSLAERVATQLSLVDDPRFYERFSFSKADSWFEGGRLNPGASTREERLREAGNILLSHVDIVPARLSRLVTISFTSPDAAFSQKIANAWAAQFIQQTLARRFDTTAYARNFLEGRLESLRKRIDQSERALVDYASREAIVNLPTGSGSKDGTTVERPLVADDLAAINQELAQATADRIRAQTRLANSQGAQTSEALQSSGIAQLRVRRADLMGEYQKLLVQFDPEYPPAVALRRQIQQIDSAISKEEGRFNGALRDSYNASVARENALRAQVKQYEARVLDFRRRSIQYNIYHRDVDTNQQLYDGLLQRYKQIGIAGGVGVNNIAIVDNADLPLKPSRPRPLINMSIALLAGLLLGIGAAVVIEQMDDRLRDPTDIPRALHIPLLSTTPKVSGEKIQDTLLDVKSALSEAYLSLQTALSFSTSQGVPRTMAITSSQPAEGKSTTSLALAYTLARTGARVLLVDGDMRSPSVHHMLGVKNERGLSNYLSGQTGTFWFAAQVPGLSVLTAGPQPPNAAELLTGGAFRKLLDDMRADFDHIVIDAPPVMGLADAPLIGSVVEGIVFVLDSQATRRPVAQAAVGRLKGAHAHVLGALMTKFDARNSSYGYGYNYHYGYGDQAEDGAELRGRAQ